MRKVINVVAFQIGWFAAVLGAAGGMPWLGVVVVPVVVGVHLALSPDWRPQLLLALSAAVLGFMVDTVLIAAGRFSPVPYLLPSYLSPPWMVLLWVNFATTLNVSMGWLRGRSLLAAFFGAVGGPLAYASGARLGAMLHSPGIENLVFVGLAWAMALPLLYRMERYLGALYEWRKQG
jgi:hypothetical protein